MNELRRKHQRMDPLIQVRQKQLDDEILVLENIRTEKRTAIEHLRANQRQYISGVEDVNRIRQTGDNGNLLTLERGLDHVKNQLGDSLRELRLIEQKERMQLEQLYLAKRNVKSMESLKDRYKTQINDMVNKQEQKMLDEFAINRFTSDRKQE